MKTAKVEEFGGRLVRVIKSVKRKSKSGGTRTVKQAFHVRKANPGDVYSAGTPNSSGDNGEAEVARLLKKAAGAKAPGQPEEPQPEGQPEAVAPVVRMAVRFHDMPWKIGQSVKDQAEQDPVPASLRQRFDQGNRQSHAANPVSYDTPMSIVVPTDRVLWGVGEPETIERLRSGTIARMKVVSSENGLMIVKLNGRDHLAEHAYMCIESLRDPTVYSVWGEFYELEKGRGDLSRRAAAAYELSKACGLDDLVPPTAFRFDDFGDFEMVLPNDLIERKRSYHESIAARTGENPETLRKQIGGYASLFLAHRDMWTIEKEDWFHRFFKTEGDVDRKDLLNYIWDFIPEGRRLAFLRIAMLDYILWNGDRNMGDITFCDNSRHPVHASGAELSFPCPKKTGQAVIDHGVGEFLSLDPNPRIGIPMMWSDPLMKLATRGTARELGDFEKLGIATADRMKGDRSVELGRSLVEHRIPSMHVAGALSRIWLLATHSREIARNPYFVAQVYGRIMSGEDVPEMEGMATYVNETMKKVLVREFDFMVEMKESDEEEEAKAPNEV